MSATTRLPAPCVVVDASAVVERLLGGRRASAVSQAVGVAQMVAPEHLNAEVLSALARLERARMLPEVRAREAVDDLADMPVRRIALRPLLHLVWALRHKLSLYDAGYVAVAATLGCVLVTADRGIERAAAGTVPVALV